MSDREVLDGEDYFLLEQAIPRCAELPNFRSGNAGLVSGEEETLQDTLSLTVIMDGDRRVATINLLRRLGSDTTLSVNSLVFAPAHETGRFSDSDRSFSPPDWPRRQPVRNDLEDGIMTRLVGKKVEIKSQPVSRRVSENLDLQPITMFGQHDRSRKSNGVVVS